jgi:hypothetical protein
MSVSRADSRPGRFVAVLSAVTSRLRCRAKGSRLYWTALAKDVWRSRRQNCSASSIRPGSTCPKVTIDTSWRMAERGFRLLPHSMQARSAALLDRLFLIGPGNSITPRSAGGCHRSGSALPTGMPRTTRSDRAASVPPGSDKFRTYRANKRRQGLKLVRLWLPDPKSASFRRRIRQQCVALRGLPEDREALDFIEAVNEQEN